MSVYRLSELTGINQSTLANTFSRGTVPSIRHLEIICDTLGITLSQFFSTEEEIVYLTQNEIKLINNYRKLPEELRHHISEMILEVSKLQKN